MLLEQTVNDCIDGKDNQQVVEKETKVSYCGIGEEKIPCLFADVKVKYTKVYDTILLFYPLCWRHK